MKPLKHISYILLPIICFLMGISSCSDEHSDSYTPSLTPETVSTVAKISLNTTYITLEEGEGTTITATITPSSALSGTITYKSSDISVATVSSSGVVKAVKSGTSTITVSAPTTGGTITATCLVSVSQIQVTNLSLNLTSTSIDVGASTTLTATITPSNASTKVLEWTSSDASVAAVSSNGVVTGKSIGTAVITAKTTDGSNISASCTVTVNAVHEYVDLGLSVKWATCNVGANYPEEYGDYYAWGETETKSDFSWKMYKWCDGSATTLAKYCTDSKYGSVDNKTTLELSDDVAHVKWGGNWRMPTDAEITELKSKCTWTWTTQNDIKGYKVTSKNGNSIFLPAAGYYQNASKPSNVGSIGHYWSSSLNTSDSRYAYYLFFDNYGPGRNNSDRSDGRSVRPVCQ